MRHCGDCGPPLTDAATSPTRRPPRLQANAFDQAQQQHFDPPQAAPAATALVMHAGRFSPQRPASPAVIFDTLEMRVRPLAVCAAESLVVALPPWACHFSTLADMTRFRGLLDNRVTTGSIVHGGA
jgi:hypothetical protein